MTHKYARSVFFVLLSLIVAAAAFAVTHYGALGVAPTRAALDRLTSRTTLWRA